MILTIPFVLLISCAQGDPKGVKIDSETEIENEEIRIEEKESTEKGEEDTEVKPTFIWVPEGSLYEAMVISNSDVTITESSDPNSKIVDELSLGSHVFVMEEAENRTRIHSEDGVGWVHTTTITRIPYDSSKKQVVKNPQYLLVLVNKQYKLPSDYQPQNLVVPNVPFSFSGTPEKKYMTSEAAKALEEMFAEGERNGVQLVAASGYRSFTTQQQLFTSYVLRDGYEIANQFSAFPGESEHQTGLAMDVTSREVNLDITRAFGETKEGKWIQEYAHNFGFIIRYSEENEAITGYNYEPWHLRYVGKEVAQTIHEQNITFDEYVEND